MLFALVIAGCSAAHSALPQVAEAGGTVTHYVLQNGGSPANWRTFSPSGIGGFFTDVVVGPDKNLWFTDAQTERIDRVSMTGATKVFAPSVVAGFIAVGADKKFYLDDGEDALIGTMTTGGVTNRFSLPSGDQPSGLTLGPDNNIWFIEFRHVGKITKSGAITEYTLPTPALGDGTITTGPDGDLWFSEFTPSKIGKVTTSGQVTEYQIPGSPACNPRGIVKGPDGNLWFRCGSNIGRISNSPS